MYIGRLRIIYSETKLKCCHSIPVLLMLVRHFPTSKFIPGPDYYNNNATNDEDRNSLFNTRGDGSRSRTYYSMKEAIKWSRLYKWFIYWYLKPIAFIENWAKPISSEGFLKNSTIALELKMAAREAPTAAREAPTAATTARISTTAQFQHHIMTI